MSARSLKSAVVAPERATELTLNAAAAHKGRGGVFMDTGWGSCRSLPNMAVSILFDGLAYAMFLFITSVGLSVTMGLMGFVNLAHGAFAMAGGYVVVTLTRTFGIGFVPSLVIAAMVVGAVSVVFERVLYRRLYKSTDLEQVLLTIGLAFMAIATATYFYGPIPKSVPLPDWLQGDVNLGFRYFPSYRAFLIAARRRAYRGPVVRVRANQYRRQDPRRGR